jgi:hypothetical protein
MNPKALPSNLWDSDEGEPGRTLGSEKQITKRRNKITKNYHLEKICFA